MTIDDVTLGREMAAAAKAATERCLAAGYSRGDKVTKDSAKAAADDVYLRARGQHVAAEPRVIDQPRREEAQQIAAETERMFDVQDDTWRERKDLA